MLLMKEAAMSDNKLNNSMSDEILKQVKEAAFKEGAISTLEWLEEIYGEGIRDTDAWAAYMDDEETN